jgi:hypothetical protein
MSLFAGWTLSRLVLLFAAVGFTMVAVQVSLFHYRGNFRHWSMWIPVISAPILALLVAGYALMPSPLYRPLVVFALWAESLGGLTGFGMHVRGVTQRLGGFGLNNVLTGPPVVLPLTLTAFSLLGLMVLYWRI